VTQDGTTWAESFPNGSGPATESGIDLHDITYDGAHFLVVGETKAGTARAWLSEDGLTWTASQATADLASGSMHAVEIAPGGGFAAVGLSKNSPATWTSPDGISWHRAEITSPIEGAVPYSLVRLDAGLVALGTANGQTVVWTSASGALNGPSRPRLWMARSRATSAISATTWPQPTAARSSRSSRAATRRRRGRALRRDPRASREIGNSHGPMVPGSATAARTTGHATASRMSRQCLTNPR